MKTKLSRIYMAPVLLHALALIGLEFSVTLTLETGPPRGMAPFHDVLYLPRLGVPWPEYASLVLFRGTVEPVKPRQRRGVPNVILEAGFKAGKNAVYPPAFLAFLSEDWPGSGVQCMTAAADESPHLEYHSHQVLQAGLFHHPFQVF